MSKPVILFESYPDFNGSALEVYNELIKRGYDQKYDLVWAVYSNFNLKTNYKTVRFFNCNSREKQDIIKRTKCIIDSNRYIPKFSNQVYRFFVRHGLCLKNCIDYTKRVGPLDAILTTSDEMLELDKKLWPAHVKDKFVITGMPATDKLFAPKNLYDGGFLKELTGTDAKYNKIIGWLPTFRDHRCSHFNKNQFPFGLPAIHSLAEYNKLNDTLKEKNMLLIIQMHHAQAHNYKQLPKASNIAFVNEVLKNKYGLATTDLLGNFDAMITDYSSAYHEYVILDRPIALTIEDIIQYSKAHGFFCDYIEWIKGDYIIDNDDLLEWVTNISEGIDLSRCDREISLNKIHKFKDNKAAERVVNYIVETAKI